MPNSPRFVNRVLLKLRKVLLIPSRTLVNLVARSVSTTIADDKNATTKQSLLRSTASVSLMSLLSRILGFVRDVVIAQLFGAGLAADAFFAAFKAPDFLRRLFAEGAFSSAFVPTFVEANQESKEKMRLLFYLRFLVLKSNFLHEIPKPFYNYAGNDVYCQCCLKN